VSAKHAGDGSYRVGGFLLLALALWAPSARDLLHGTLDATTAGVRLLAALLLAWVAVRVVTRLLDGYAAAQRQASRRDARGAPAGPPGRRRDDPGRVRSQGATAARAPETPEAGPEG
jgi:hypothetical protein